MQAVRDNSSQDEWVSYKHLTACDNLLLVQAQFTQHAFPVHYHDEFMIELVEAGVEKFKHKGVTHYAPSQHLILINPGEVHSAVSGSNHPWRYRAFYPSFKWLETLAHETELNLQELGFHKPITRDARLVEKFKQAHCRVTASNDKLEQESTLVEFFSDLLVRLAHKTLPLYKKEHKAVRQIKDYLEAHVPHAVPLSKLSDVTGFSSYHLLKVFKGHTGLSPHHYQTQLRIRVAYQKLSAGSEAKDVATEVGFFDQSHFIKTFRHYYGVTPAQLFSKHRPYQHN
jgi:AraC-like DNA-binding protein